LLIFDIRAFWRLVLSAKVPKCQQIKNGGLELDQYGTERFSGLILPQSEQAFIDIRLRRGSARNLSPTLSAANPCRPRAHYDQM